MLNFSQLHQALNFAKLFMQFQVVQERRSRKSRIRDAPVSGRHGDTAQTGATQSGTVPTGPDMGRHGPAWLQADLASRSEGSGQ